MISTAELAAGIKIVVSSHVGISRDGLLKETTRAFGFQRQTANITAAMEKALSLLEKGKVVQIEGDKVLLKS